MVKIFKVDLVKATHPDEFNIEFKFKRDIIIYTKSPQTAKAALAIAEPGWSIHTIKEVTDG